MYYLYVVVNPAVREKFLIFAEFASAERRNKYLFQLEYIVYDRKEIFVSVEEFEEDNLSFEIETEVFKDHVYCTIINCENLEEIDLLLKKEEEVKENGHSIVSVSLQTKNKRITFYDESDPKWDIETVLTKNG